MAVGDFNRDGIPDLATANFGSNNVTVLPGNGSRGFGAAAAGPFAVGAGPYSVASGDFNGDGIPDLATANVGSNNVTVLLGDGSGGFSAATGSPFAVGTSPRSVVVGDFNGDGVADLAIANNSSDNVTVLLGNGAGGFSAATGIVFAVGTAPNYVAVGDFNGDGRTDLVASNFLSDNVTVLPGGLAATGSLLSTTAPPTITPGTSVPLTLAVSDTVTAFSTPSGAATFLDGTTVLGAATQNASPIHSTRQVWRLAPTR